jgi:predicted nucleic acid-binding protein
MNSVVADAGPLIGLARIGRLNLLRKIFGTITIPRQVFNELKLSSDRPGTKAILKAIDSGWIKLEKVKNSDKLSRLHLLVDAGEAEAILLALERDARVLIIDDRKGRKTAKRLRLRLLGTGGVLVAAKRAGHLKDVTSVLTDLADAGYHLSPNLSKRIIELAGEEA